MKLGEQKSRRKAAGILDVLQGFLTQNFAFQAK
jgi:hypothetical protein